MEDTKLSDKDINIDILTRFLKFNQSDNHIGRQHKRIKKRIQTLMIHSFEVCYLFGDVFLSDDKKACTLIIYPNKKLLGSLQMCCVNDAFGVATNATISSDPRPGIILSIG